MEANQPHIFLQFVPLLVMSLVIGIQSVLLAKEKGRNVALWGVLGFLPVINFFSIWYFAGASNLKHEQMLKAILGKLGEP